MLSIKRKIKNQKKEVEIKGIELPDREKLAREKWKRIEKREKDRDRDREGGDREIETQTGN